MSMPYKLISITNHPIISFLSANRFPYYYIASSIAHIFYNDFNKLIRRMSQLLFKIMVHSYCRYKEQKNVMEDCLNAICSGVTEVGSKVNEEYKQIAQVLSLQQNQMSVIMEEQTERSQPEIIKYDQWMKHTKQRFNNEATKLRKIQQNVEKLVDTYKNELLEMSKQMTKWETKNQQMKLQIRNVEKVKKMLEIQNNQLKDQITSQSASYFMNEINDNIQSVFNVNKTKTDQTAKNTTINKTQQIQKLENHKSKNIKTNNASSVSPKFSKQSKRPSVIQVRIHEEKQIEQDLEKWKKLSKKLDSLKSKLVNYEQQIQQKDELIKKLKLQLKGGQSTENQEKRKIKTANTTLRGEKTVLQNQLASVKKLLTEKTELCRMQQIELQSLRTQIQDVTQNAKCQNTIINELKQNISKTHGKSQLESQTKVQRLEQINSKLVETLIRQQNELNEINSRTKEIEDILDLKINRMNGRITELQMILDEKNECIVRMKNKQTIDENCNPNIPEKNGYLTELVRVLTKKVADRDQVIRRMELKM